MKSKPSNLNYFAMASNYIVVCKKCRQEREIKLINNVGKTLYVEPNSPETDFYGFICSNCENKSNNGNK